MAQWTQAMYRACEDLESLADRAIGSGLTVEQFRDVAQHAYLDALRERTRATVRDLEER